MDNNKIKEIIDKYHLVRMGDKVGTHQTKGIDKAEFVAEVGPLKADILAYFDAQDRAEKERREKREKTFEAIMGVAELRKARAQRAEWKRAFNRMMETGDGTMPTIESLTDQQMDELEQEYPMAVFALEAEWRKDNSTNTELLKIWKATYDALCDGEKPETVKEIHDKKMKENVDKHIWD